MHGINLADLLVYGFVGAITLASALLPWLKRPRKKMFEIAGRHRIPAGLATHSDEAGSFTIESFESGKGRIPGAKVSISCEPIDLEITPRNAWDSFCYAIGLSRPLSCENKQFESRFVIGTGAPSEMRAFLAAPEVQQAIETLFDRGFTAIEGKESTITAVVWPFWPATEDDTRVLKEAVPSLRAMAMPIAESFQTALGSGGRITWRKLGRGKTALGIAALALGFGIWLYAGVMRYRILDKEPLQLYGAAAGLAVAFLFVVATNLGSRDLPSIHRRMTVAWVTFAMGMLFAALGASTLANSEFDAGPVVEHVVPVTSARVISHQGKHGTSFTFEATLRSWRPGRASETIAVSREVFDRIQEAHDHTMVVECKPGLLGFEWVASYQIKP